MLGAAEGCSGKGTMIVVDPNHTGIDCADRSIRFVLVLRVDDGREAEVDGVGDSDSVFKGVEGRDSHYRSSVI